MSDGVGDSRLLRNSAPPSGVEDQEKSRVSADASLGKLSLFLFYYWVDQYWTIGRNIGLLEKYTDFLRILHTNSTKCTP